MAALDAIWVGGYPAKVYRNGNVADSNGNPITVTPGTTCTAMGDLAEAEQSDNWVILDYNGTIVDQRHIGIGLDGIAYVDTSLVASGTVLTVEQGLVTVTATPA